jgi:hypothetical protein
MLRHTADVALRVADQIRDGEKLLATEDPTK